MWTVGTEGNTVWTIGTAGHTVWTAGTEEGHTVWTVGKRAYSLELLGRSDYKAQNYSQNNAMLPSVILT